MPVIQPQTARAGNFKYNTNSSIFLSEFMRKSKISVLKGMPTIIPMANQMASFILYTYCIYIYLIIICFFKGLYPSLNLWKIAMHPLTNSPILRIWQWLKIQRDIFPHRSTQIPHIRVI